MPFRGRSFALTSLVMILVTCGCGPSGPRKYPVSGVVKFKGDPVGEGTVSFFSPKVGSVGVELDIDGAFNFESSGGLEEGEYKVYIDPPSPFTSPPGPGGPPMTKPKEYLNIPQKYRQAATTEFSVVIDGEKKDLEFDMKP